MKSKMVFNSKPSICRFVLAVLSVMISGMAIARQKADSLIEVTTNTGTRSVDMATAMRSNGKIYVVVAVLTIILTGIFLYLIRLDRKIARLEKENDKDV